MGCERAYARSHPKIRELITGIPKKPANFTYQAPKSQYNSAILEAAMDEPVLVLNANFEPIHVCNTRRAIGL
ncbi:MAG: hypothetical protein R6W69_14250, partial [Anaerolineales bacterium]